MIALLAALQASPQQNFPALNRPGTFGDLRGSVERVCSAPAGLDLKELLDRERRAAASVRGSRVPVDAWSALGCARAILAGVHALSASGPLMDSGNSWAEGTVRAMQQVLVQRPGDVRALEVLSLVVVDDNEAGNLPAITSELITAVGRGVQTAPILRACAELALHARADVSRDCSRRALQSGTDSVWHLMRLAQLAFRACDTVSGNKDFILAATVARDSAAREEVNWHLQWFLAPAELQQWMSVAHDRRPAWIRDKLNARDVRDGQPLGARLAEHFARLDYVETNFRLHPPRMKHNSLRTGPATTEEGLSPVNPDLLVLSAAEPALVNARMWRHYNRWQTDLDDRSVIWMRFGAPAKRVSWVCARSGCSNKREAWLYEIDGEQMILSFENEGFDGSADPARLVTGVLGSYFCDLDPRRCFLSNRSSAAAQGGPPLHTEDIERIRVEDQQSIDVATTNDDNSPRGETNIPVVSRLHRLWDPLSGAPIALVTYAMPVKDLAIQHDSSDRVTVHLDLRQWDATGNHWTDTTLVRRFMLPDTTVRRPQLVGFVTVPSTTAVSAWSLVATQSGRRGRAYDVKTPGLASGSTELSDLVLGADAQGVIWNFHNVAIPLAPTGVFKLAEPISLYYQIRSTAGRSDLRTTVALYKVESGVARDTASLEVAFDQSVNAGINEIAPTLDVSRPGRGRYSLEVRITDAGGTVLARRSVVLDLE